MEEIIGSRRRALRSGALTLLVWVAFGCEGPEDVYAPPDTPSAPTIKSGDSELTVTWEADRYATFYEVYYSTSDDSAAATRYPDDSDDTDTTCVITGLENGTLYYVWIRASNSHGQSDFSESASGTPAATLVVPDPPAAPAIAAGDGELTLSWDVASDAASYEVYYGTSADSAVAAQFTGDTNATDTSCVVTGLENGTLYHLWIKAVNAAGASDFSPPASGTPVEDIAIPDPPAAPTLVTGNTELAATWEAVSGATSYEVYYATDDNSSSAAQFDGDADATDTACVITGLENVAFYYVWVKAVNSAGASDFSPWARVRVGAQTMSVGAETFRIVHVPGMTFPTGGADDGVATVSDPYWIASTEVTYGLWHQVYMWAVDNGYTFSNAGMEGHDGIEGAAPTAAANEPVTWVDWCDALMWTNALTEYFNDVNGSTLECAYQDLGEPIRDASNLTICGAAELHPTATGFRMPTGDEFELAARFIGDFNGDGDIMDSGEFYLGGFASGADTWLTNLAPEEDHDGDGDLDTSYDVCVAHGNNPGGTAEVGTMNPNSLGMYDVCGNVDEWCFTDSPDGVYSMHRGGSWAAPPWEVSYHGFYYRDDVQVVIGFRIAMSE